MNDLQPLGGVASAGEGLMSQSTKDDGGPAFPRPASIDPTNGTLPDGDRVREEQDGMTLRDYFAANAMQSYARATTALKEPITPECLARIIKIAARESYHWADAMLAARKA